MSTPNNFLGIETSFNNTGICLLKGDDSFLEITSGQEGRHQENLFSLIAHLFQQLSIQVAELTGIGVTVGPGMFTSLRVGLAAAKSLSFPHNIPVKGIDSFLGLAETFYHLFPEERGMVIPVIDAKREQVYAQPYEGKKKIGEPILASPEEVTKKYQDGIFIGSALNSYPGFFKGRKKANIFLPSPFVVALLAREAIKRGEVDDVGELVPFYIKAPDIRSPRSL